MSKESIRKAIEDAIKCQGGREECIVNNGEFHTVIIWPYRGESIFDEKKDTPAFCLLAKGEECPNSYVEFSECVFMYCPFISQNKLGGE